MSRQTRAKKHTHKYYRRPDKLWACALECTHFMPTNMSPAPEGHRSICWECDEEFILTSTNMTNDYPKCNNCSGVNILEEIANKRFMELGITKDDPYAAFRSKPSVTGKKSEEPDEPESEET